MGFISRRPRKYDYTSDYLSDREEAMYDRVNKICQEHGFKDKTEGPMSLKDRIESHKTTNIVETQNSKVKYIIIVALIVAALYFLVYLFTRVL